MKPRHNTAEETGSLDELIAAHVARLSEKLARPHTLEDLESELRSLNELVESFKFRDVLLNSLEDDRAPVSQRSQLKDTLVRHREIVRANNERISELTARSHQLIDKSEKLFARLAVEKPLTDSSLLRQKNLLLAALPAAEYARLIPGLKRVSISMGKFVQHAAEPISYIYFPETAVLSILASMKSGASVEVGVVGNEGMSGVRVLFGGDATPHHTVVQVGGTALRMKVGALRDVISRSGLLQKLLLRYSQSVITQLRQTAACKNFHSVERRLARWLLTIHDYIETDEIVLTQSQMAQAIGSRLAGVSEAAGRLQKAGLIRYSRGHISILDRRSLEAAACECYKILRNEITQLYECYLDANPAG